MNPLVAEQYRSALENEYNNEYNNNYVTTQS